MLVLRTKGTEKFIKPHMNSIKAMEKRGLISGYNPEFGYIEGDYAKTRFNFNGIEYKIEYFSGCFYPFLLRLV